MSTKVTAQPLKWHGGKSYLAKWLHSLAPPSVHDDPTGGYTHRNIVFAGGLGEFWNWLPINGISETVNDANSQLANLYAVIRDSTSFAVFRELCEASPFSSDLWTASSQADAPILTPNDPNSAHAFFVRYRMSRQGLGRDYATPTTRTRRGMNEQVSAWLSAVEGLPDCHERLRRVEIRNLDCVKFIEAYDHPRALFYCDPPYLHETRSSTGEYGKHEMTPADHKRLLDALVLIKGRFMLSGYPSRLYASWASLHGFKCFGREIDNKASSAKSKEIKTECAWTNH